NDPGPVLALKNQATFRPAVTEPSINAEPCSKAKTAGTPVQSPPPPPLVHPGLAFVAMRMAEMGIGGTAREKVATNPGSTTESAPAGFPAPRGWLAPTPVMPRSV